jgi:threonine dehydrogenase-like Zn-dependent dehydrogenase
MRPVNVSNQCITFLKKQTVSLETAPFCTDLTAGDEIISKTVVSVVSPGSESGGFMDYLGISHFPYVTGYAAVSEVLAAGEDAGFAPGDLVFSQHPHQQYQRIQAKDAVRLPKGIAPEAAVLSRFPAVSMTTLVNTKIKPVEPVAVIGLGIIGLMCAQVLRHCGYTVFAADPVPARRETAAHCGILHTFASVKEIEKESCGIVFECSGSEIAMMDSLACIRKGGELSLIGVPWRKSSDISMHELLRQIFYGYITVYSGWEWSIPLHSADFLPYSCIGNLAKAMEWIQDGAIRTEGIYETYLPADCERLYTSIADHTFNATCAVFDWRNM